MLVTSATGHCRSRSRKEKARLRRPLDDADLPNMARCAFMSPNSFFAKPRPSFLFLHHQIAVLTHIAIALLNSHSRAISHRLSCTSSAERNAQNIDPSGGCGIFLCCGSAM